MNTSVAEHYANHLGPIYSWMAGDFEAASENMAAYFADIGLRVESKSHAVDLGCGHGIQAVPLAKLGFEVTALDTCQHLLDELTEIAAAQGLPIRTINDDLSNFAQHLDGPVAAIICMGDTLPHLESPDHVAELMANAAEALQPQGVLCVSLRDYASAELQGNDRFIPVRSDNTRIHTCFLEYEPTIVRVHDIIHTRSSTGWETSVSSYPKLRLALDNVESLALAQGLRRIHRSETRGMHSLAFERQ